MSNQSIAARQTRLWLFRGSCTGTKHYEIGKREFRCADVGLGDGGFSESWSKSIAAGRSVSGPASGNLDVRGLLRCYGMATAATTMVPAKVVKLVPEGIDILTATLRMFHISPPSLIGFIVPRS